MLPHLAAEAVLALHFAFLLFVVFGGLVVLRLPRLAWVHVPALVWGVVVSVMGWICPLTPLENHFRRLAGDAAYGGTFLDRYVAPIVYPSGLTRPVQIGLGLALLAWNLALYGLLLRRRNRRPEAEAETFTMRLLLAMCLLLAAPLAVGCGEPLGAKGSGPEPYEVSADPTVEILYLGSYGGMGFLSPQYRLYGDGRLVREIVHKGSREPQEGMTAEVMLSQLDTEALMDLVVAARLPELTPDRLKEAMGRKPLPMVDGQTFVLNLRFDEYGDKTEGFSPQIKMHAPTLQARFFPEVAEVQGMVTLLEALEGFFPQSAKELLYGRAEQ